MYNTAEVRMRNMVFIDNHKGLSIQTGSGDKNLVKVRLYDIEIFGEDERLNLDCPDSHDCWCGNKHGLMLSSCNFGGKPLHPSKPSALPISKIKSYGSWGGDIEF